VLHSAFSAELSPMSPFFPCPHRLSLLLQTARSLSRPEASFFLPGAIGEDPFFTGPSADAKLAAPPATTHVSSFFGTLFWRHSFGVDFGTMLRNPPGRYLVFLSLSSAFPTFKANRLFFFCGGGLGSFGGKFFLLILQLFFLSLVPPAAPALTPNHRNIFLALKVGIVPSFLFDTGNSPPL